MTQGEPGNADADPGSETLGLASVILIDRREDIASICGKVDSAPTFAVVLHAPNGNRQISTELGIRRLARHVEESGKVVAIATPVVNLASRARQVGIPVSRRPENVRWDSGGRRVLRIAGRNFATPALGRYLQVAFILGVALSLAGLAFTVAPSSKVVVYPSTETLVEVVTIVASRDRDTFDVNSMRVPARDITVSRTITLVVRTSGTANVGTTAAAVMLTITNPTSAEATIPPGTSTLAGAGGTAFLLDSEVKIPAKGTVTVAATADRPGVMGNVAPGAVNAWADAKYASLSVTNPAPAAGGLDEAKPAVDASDIAAIKALADELAKSGALTGDMLRARPHDAVFARTAETTVRYGEPSATPGTPATVLLLEVDVEVTVLAVVESMLNELAVAVLRPRNGTGEFVPGTVTAVEVDASRSSGDSGDISARLRIQAEFAPNLTRQALKDAVKGKSVSGAKSTLAGRYGIQDADVSVSPAWAPRLPRFDFRISVEMGRRPAGKDSLETQTNDATPTTTRTTTPNPRP